MSTKSRRDIPRFNFPLIETHCHLDYLDHALLHATLARSHEVGVERIITIAVSPDNLERVVELTRYHPSIWGTQGIHPHEAHRYCADVAATIRAHACDTRIVAVGEIGLDYYYDHTDRTVQRKVFVEQLQIAADLNLPVVIHTREADDDTRDILRDFVGTLSRKGVVHSFTSGQPLAQFCLEEGFMLGFNGIATFNRAENVRAIVAITPVDRLLLETDSPYLTPVPYRGHANAPYFLPFIAERVASIKGLEVNELLRLAYRNSMNLFFADT